MLGVPVTLRSDGGPQFSGRHFIDFMARWGVNHLQGCGVDRVFIGVDSDSGVGVLMSTPTPTPTPTSGPNPAYLDS